MKKSSFWSHVLSLFDGSGFCLFLSVLSVFGIGFSSWVISADDNKKQTSTNLNAEVADVYDLSLYFQNVSVSTLRYTDGCFIEDETTGTTKDLGNFQVDGKILCEDIKKNIGDFSIKLTMCYSSNKNISLFDFVDADESAHGKDAKYFCVSDDGKSWGEDYGVEGEKNKIVMSYSPDSLNQDWHFRLGFRYSDSLAEALGSVSNIEFYFSLVVK